MRQSKLFTKTQKDAPKDEISVNAQMLSRGGFTDKLRQECTHNCRWDFAHLKK